MKKNIFILFTLKIPNIGKIQFNIVNNKDNLTKKLFSNFLFNLMKTFNTHQNVATLSSKIPLLTGNIRLKTSFNL